MAPIYGASLPLETWTFSPKNGLIAEQTTEGIIRLSDNNPEATPHAALVFSKPVTSGELTWRARHVQGRGTLVHTLRLHTQAGSWEVAVFNGSVALRNTGERGSLAYAPAGADWFALGQWANFRLLFDAKEGRAQLYLNGHPEPVAEINEIPASLEKITLSAGHDVAIGNAAEFSDLHLRSGSVAFHKVKQFRRAQPPQKQNADEWPELKAAPDEWTVKDKYAQFASWWPGKSGDAQARNALRHAMRREALGLGNEFTAALKLVPTLANAIRWQPPYQGAQQSRIYRMSPSWDRPSNTRLMECVMTLVHFYAIEQPWNPYHRDPALGKRLKETLEFWLSLQCPEGGFPENASFGSNELPAVSFGLMAMVEIYDALKDEPLFAEISPRWIDSMRHAVLWGAIPDSQQRRQGISHANQYIGVISGAWHLHRITGEARWKTIYDQLTDWWIATAQTKDGWYREGGGREDFAYSLVSDLYGDRLAIETGDPRWIESLRRACLSSQMLVVHEMDLKTTVMDVTGHARTAPSPSLNFTPSAKGSVTNPWQNSHSRQRYAGWFNHMATLIPEARCFVVNAFTAEEAAAMEQRFFDAMPASLSWRNHTPHMRNSQGGAFAWDNGGAYWPLPQNAQADAAKQSRPWKETRFTEVFLEKGDELACIRRPDYYATFRASTGKHGRQVLGLGLFWMPGFGTVFSTSNITPPSTPARPAFGWKANGRELGLLVRKLRMDWEGGEAQNTLRLVLRGNEDLPAIDFGLGEETFAIKSTQTPFYLPLVSRGGEVWTLSDGSTWHGAQVKTSSLRLRRMSENVTHDVLMDFGQAVSLKASNPSAIGADLIVSSMSVTPQNATELKITLRRLKR